MRWKVSGRTAGVLGGAASRICWKQHVLSSEVHTHTHTHTHTYIYICVCVCVCMYACVCTYIYIYQHHHHVMPPARIPLTLSRHSSLSFIAFGRSSGLHPVSSQSCWMYVRAGRPAFARPYDGIYRRTSLMSSKKNICMYKYVWASPHGIMSRVPDCGQQVNKFELQSRYYVHSHPNTLWKSIRLLPF